MKRMFFLFISILVLLGAVGCDLLEEIIGEEEEVGETVIRSHTFQWYDGRVTHIKLSWDWAENTEVHSLERSAPDDGQGFTGIFWDKMSDFDDAGWELPGNVFTSGHRYVYRVRGHSEDGGFGPWSPDYTVTIPHFLPPENVKATLLEFKEDQTNADSYTVRVQITWDPVDIDGVKYKVYRSDNLDGYYEDLSISAQPELIFENYFSVNIPDPSTTVSRYYKVSSNYDEYGESIKSEAAVVDLKKVDGIDPGGTTGSWTELNNGFTSQASSINLVNYNDMLYALFVDEGDSNRRIKAMSNNGSDGASWSTAGDYLSLAAVEGDYACLYADSNGLYVSYADTDDWLYVKKWDGASWVAVGAEDGICVENENGPENPPEYKDGTVPALTVYNSQPFMVYRSTSFGLVESLSYPGSDTLWNETDCDYWTNGSIGASWIGLYVDDSNRPVAILQSGSTPNINLHTYDGTWSPLGTYNLGTEDYMEIFDYLVNGSDIYLAHDSHNITTHTYKIQRLSGGSVSDTGFISKLDDVYGVKDISICRWSSGSGIIAAVVYMKTNNIYYTEVWDYDGSSWTQKGPDIQLDGKGSEIALALDSSNRPVVIYTDGAAVKAEGFRE